MTVFDAIRYQISNPPTVAELEAIPAELFHKWRKLVGFFYNDTTLGVAKWYEEWYNLDVTKEVIKGELQILRKMIGEWDD